MYRTVTPYNRIENFGALSKSLDYRARLVVVRILWWLYMVMMGVEVM